MDRALVVEQGDRAGTFDVDDTTRAFGQVDLGTSPTPASFHVDRASPFRLLAGGTGSRLHLSEQGPVRRSWPPSRGVSGAGPPMPPTMMMPLSLTRRQMLSRSIPGLGLAPIAAACLAGCSIEADVDASTAATPGLELLWGLHGVRDGRLHRPRVIALDANDQLYIADLTDRIQVFDRDGHYKHGWRTPGLNVDGPSGLTVDATGRVLVADTHFYRVLIYDREGTRLGQIGDGVQGTTPGRFGYATDTLVDEAGCVYVSEYGENDRIQVFDPAGEFLRQWGGHGYAPGQFLRPRAMAFDGQGLIHVADTGNHRIQVFDRDGRLINRFGRRGASAGQMAYPFDLSFAPDGTLVVCEYGNSRVQRFDGQGKSLGVWGGPGREPGRLDNPCAAAVDRTGAVHVVDSNNHRVQRFRFDAAA